MKKSDGVSVIGHIVATMRIQPPFSYGCVFGNAAMSKCSPAGINADIFRAVMLFLNIDYSLILAEDDTTGYTLPNGTWRGMIGQLLRGEANMTASLIGVEPERLKFIDYSAPVSYYDNGFIINKQATNRYRGGLPTFILTPLSAVTWYSLFGSLVCMVFMVFITNYIVYRRNAAKVMSDAWFGVSRALLRQTYLEPKLGGLRILLSFWEIALFFVAAYYSAHLTSSLMVRPKEIYPFNGMDEFSGLVYDNKYTVVLNNAPAKWTVRINDSYDDAYQRLRLAFQWNPPVYVDTMKEVVRKISANSSLVYFGSIYQLMDATAAACQVTIIEDRFTMPNWLSFGFPKGSPLVEMISLSLHTDSFSVNSYLQRLYRRYARKRSCLDEEHTSSSYISLTLAHMSGAFIALTWGFCIAFVLCIVERIGLYILNKNTNAQNNFDSSLDFRT